MSQRPPSPAYVLGVGLTKLIKARGKVEYTELGFEAGIRTLLDAQLNYDSVDQGTAYYCNGDSNWGQRVFYQLGMTGIPIYNVNNNCSTGSTDLHRARQAVSHGAADCVMIVGFEKMFPGSLGTLFKDIENPTGTKNAIMAQTRGVRNSLGDTAVWQCGQGVHGASRRRNARLRRDPTISTRPPTPTATFATSNT